MTGQTSVTALVPAYQAGEFIQATLDSLSAQTHARLKVLVSVDFSDDDTCEICERHAARDPRFQVVRQNTRLGWIGNSNFLLGRADTDYALFAFHDDILLPTYVEKLCRVLDDRPGVVLSYSDALLTRANGDQEQWIYTELDGIKDRIQRGLKVFMRTGKWWVPVRGIFRLRIGRKIRGLKMHGGGEFSAGYPWVFHMSLLGEFERVPEILCHKFYRPGSLSRSWTFSKKQFHEASASCMRELWNADIPTCEKIQLAVPMLGRLAENQNQK
jgi:glycosyltransferase involved in cell wall biosynthesis